MIHLNKMKKFSLLMIISLFLASCGNEEKPVEEVKTIDPKSALQSSIAELEKKMHSNPQIDKVLAGQALQMYFEYATNYPKDSITPDYYFKSGEIATAIQQYPQAYANYQIICETYPKYKLIEESYFLQASVLDNYLNDDEKAKVVYEQLLAKFPEGRYAADAKAAINNLGKSDAELIKEFQKKNGGK